MHNFYIFWKCSVLKLRKISKIRKLTKKFRQLEKLRIWNDGKIQISKLYRKGCGLILQNIRKVKIFQFTFFFQIFIDLMLRKFSKIRKTEKKLKNVVFSLATKYLDTNWMKHKQINTTKLLLPELK